jgi:diguanylate cyclase (GGDEF)-like protein
MKRLIEYLSSRSAWTLAWMGLTTVIAIGFADYWTGHELTIFIFYIVPVAFVASFGGIWPGLAISLASALAWLLADLLASRQYSHSFIPYWNAAMRLCMLSIVVILQSALTREKYSARTDDLTGLANRKHFFEVAMQEIQRALRYNQPFSAAYIDIDNFKGVNDRHGHAAGDALLRSVGSTIMENIRSVDFAARLGGDEFAILLTQADAESARTVISKLKRLLDETMSRKQWPVTFSFGVVTFLKAPSSADELLGMADKLMYDAKAGGKNAVQYAIYDKQPRVVSEKPISGQGSG